jgi:hypothetical protein
MMTGMMVYIHNLRTQEAEEEDHKFEASLGCRVESYLKKKKGLLGKKKVCRDVSEALSSCLNKEEAGEAKLDPWKLLSAIKVLTFLHCSPEC